jgi:UDP-N-acetylmuramyl pentapeptide synthase
MKPRRFLSYLLKVLSKWAIRKHKLRIAAVVGTSGTKLTAEMFGEMLSIDHIVRKQLEKPFWDFSIPLSILGIDDRRYTILGWLDVILESFKVLMFGKSNPGWVVLQLNSLKDEIVDYWIEIVEPDITIVSNYNGALFPIEKRVARVSKSVVLICNDIDRQKDLQFKSVMIGTGKGCDMKVDRYKQDKHGTRFVLQYKKRKHSFIAAQTGIFMKGPILTSVAALIVIGKQVDDVVERLRKVEISIERFIHE